MNLFDLSKEQQEIRARLEALLGESGEVTPENEALVDRLCDEALENEYALAAKFDDYAYVIAGFEAEAEVLEERARAIQARAAARRNAAARMKERLKTFMEHAEIKKVEGTDFVFAIQANGGRLPLVYRKGVRPEDVDASYHRVRLDFDATAIYDALQRGEKLDFVTLGERGTHLRIR